MERITPCACVESAAAACVHSIICGKMGREQATNEARYLRPPTTESERICRACAPIPCAHSGAHNPTVRLTLPPPLCLFGPHPSNSVTTSLAPYEQAHLSCWPSSIQLVDVGSWGCVMKHTISSFSYRWGLTGYFFDCGLPHPQDYLRLSALLVPGSRPSTRS